MMRQLQKYYLVLLSACVAFGVLLNLTGNSLFWDDGYFITKNAALGNLSEFPRVLIASFWDNSSFSAYQPFTFWRPFTSLLLWLIGFTGRSPWVFHSASLIVAGGAAIAFARLLNQLFYPTDLHHPLGYIAALIYVIHPLTTEVLCMVMNLADHLCLLFIFLSLRTTLIQLQTEPRAARSFFIFTTALLACFSKEFGILTVSIFPLASLLLSSTQQGKVNLFSKRNLSLWCATIFPSVVYLLLRHMLDHPIQMGHTTAESAQFLFLGVGQAALHILNVAPAGIHVFVSPADTTPWILSLLVVCALFFLTTSAYLRKKRIPFFSVSILFGLILILPTLAGASIISDSIRFPLRYFHLLLVGAVMGICPTLRTILDTRLKYAILLLIILLSGMSWIKIQQWRSPVSLFRAEVTYNPSSPNAIINYCEALFNHYAFTDAEKALDRYEKNAPKHLSLEYQARLLSIRSQILFARDGNLKDAHLLASEALRRQPYSPLLIGRLIRILTAQHKFTQARQLIDDAMADRHFTELQRRELQKDRDFIMKMRAQSADRTQTTQ